MQRLLVQVPRGMGIVVTSQSQTVRADDQRGNKRATGTVGTEVPSGQGAGRGIHRSFPLYAVFASRVA